MPDPARRSPGQPEPERRTLHVLDSGAAPGAYNLALDEALLEDERLWMRFYRWEPACLSLGYFQKLGDFEDLPPSLPRVRRPTGGGAILHDGELTLSFALDEPLLPRKVQLGYELLNDAVLQALDIAGLRVAGPEDAPDPASPAALQRWCFFRPTGLDLVTNAGAKLFGSAQRRRAGRLLHHGSLVLERSAYTPFTAALHDHDTPAWPSLCERIATEFARRLSLSIAICEALPAEIEARARELVVERYANSSWNASR
jgi:lipoate-protein ligase A